MSRKRSFVGDPYSVSNRSFDAEEASLANQAGGVSSNAAAIAVPEPPTFSTHTWAVAAPNAVDSSTVTGFHTTSFYVSGSPSTSSATSADRRAALGYVDATANNEATSASEGQSSSPLTAMQTAQGDHAPSSGDSAHLYNASRHFLPESRGGAN